jgi:dTMP kinase
VNALTTGRFITFEGIEGVGKSTQLAALARRIAAAGREVVLTREPGGTPFAERIRALVLGPAGEPVPAEAELLLMAAARAVHVANLVRPALARGAIVLCDRYTDATHAYQGAGRGLATDDIDALGAVATRGLAPDLTLLLDAPVAVALARARGRAGSGDRIEAETQAFFERARARYLERAAREPKRIRRIDASAAEAVVAAAIWIAVAPLVGAA